MTRHRLKLAVFGSGEGTTFNALAEACRTWLSADICCVVSSRAGVGLLERARRHGLVAAVVPPEDFDSPREHAEELLKLCREADAELVCLAGYLKKLEPQFLKIYENRVLNIHPALLPAFGGKGMWGRAVHEAVLASGAKVSGCTVHVVDEKYDHGPIVAQTTVPVLGDDTPDTLAQRVRQSERWLYPQVVELFAKRRVRVEAGRVEVLPEAAPRRVRRALLSVSDKAGLVEFAKGLCGLGVELVATGGTATALAEAGLPVRPLSSLTFSPEMLGGRVKTLHPRVHGGLLFKRGSQAEEAGRHGLEPIDLVVVNLYPFEATAAKIDDPFDPELIEQIDIGGPAMIRSAAKNHSDVIVACDPADYGRVLNELRERGDAGVPLRRELARKAFDHTARYDRAIADKLSSAVRVEPVEAPIKVLPEKLEFSLEKIQDLRYGENPHQAGALYKPAGGSSGFEQLHGKELSYNNLLDAEAAFQAAAEFSDRAAVAIVKHNNPCGIGAGETAVEAWTKAWDCDPTSAFGGVVAVNRPVDAALADALSEKFLEVVLAPGFEPAALERLKAKKNLRLLVWTGRAERVVRSVGSAFLVQGADDRLYEGGLRSVTRREPSKEERRALEFAWAAAKHVRSNAIVLALADRTVGIGAGQTSRVDAVVMAGIKSAAFRQAAVGRGGVAAKPVLALASDAFFPFRDGIDEAAKLGVTAIVQPGGSVRDAEVIAAADEHGIAMLLTGMRHFKH